MDVACVDRSGERVAGRGRRRLVALGVAAALLVLSGCQVAGVRFAVPGRGTVEGCNQVAGHVTQVSGGETVIFLHGTASFLVTGSVPGTVTVTFNQMVLGIFPPSLVGEMKVSHSAFDGEWTTELVAARATEVQGVTAVRVAGSLEHPDYGTTYVDFLVVDGDVTIADRSSWTCGFSVPQASEQPAA